MSVVVIHGCCKAPRTRSMVTGESEDAVNDAVNNGAPVALYYTCILTSTLADAGVRGLVFPKDCRSTPGSYEMGVDASSYINEVETFEEELLAEAREETDGRSPPVEGLRDGALRAVLKAFAGPEVAWYVTVKKLRRGVLDYLSEKSANLPDPYVLVTHSLGSIIGYEAVAEQILQPTALVTVGSPLAWKTIRRRLPDRPEDFPTWVNFWDPHDWANKRRRIELEGVDNVEVDNPPIEGDHDFYGYLTHPEASSRLKELVGG